MRVEIRFRGPLAAKKGMQVFHVEIEEGANLEMTLKSLIDSEEAVEKVWTNAERMDREALILRNESDVGLTGGLSTVLEDGDKIMILPLVHGG
ncbi:MAG: MoaD/ThiS family protein [Candidatus Thorarchaeota archaeon]|jgi:molybdopterin converting factor small subunit